ncbi:MAG TPA: nuclear transport factor 2 family protein [Rhizorhapis sp.]
MAGDPETNKQRLREQRARAQRYALPSALPGQEDKFDLQTQTPLVGFTPASILVAADSPVSPTDTPEDFMVRARGFPSQALGPTYLTYGPMLADGDIVFEEWESQIYGANGELYNNQYCWLLRFEGEEVVAMREYNDTHHAALTFGELGKWPELAPPVHPRRRSSHGAKSSLQPSEIETVFEVVDAFDLNPAMLADIVPSASAPPVRIEGDAEGNKALIRALRQARADGDPAVVGSFYSEDFRHFMAGERPFGWDHLPLEEIYAPLVAHLASPIGVRYGPPLAEGDRVIEEMDVIARLDDGTLYNNWHCFVHEIRDGKIVQTREYLDTHHMWVALGRWASWGRTPVPPRSVPRRSNLQEIATVIQYPTMFLELDRWKPFGPPPHRTPPDNRES